MRYPKLIAYPLFFPDPVIPPGDDPPVTDPHDSQPGRGVITCEGCGSRLDSRGNLVRRGDRLREALDSEESVTALRKQLTKATETITERDAEIASLKSQITPESKQSLWKRKVR